MGSPPSDHLPLMKAIAPTDESGDVDLSLIEHSLSLSLEERATVVDPHDGDVDVTLLWHMLSMTPAERLDYHDAVRKSALELRRAGRKHYGITGYDDIDPESVAPSDGSAD